MNGVVRKKVASFLHTADDQLDRALTMVLSLTIVFGLSSLVRFSTGNPYSISNIPHAKDGWSPESNYARVLFIIFTSVALYFVIQWIRSRFSDKWFRIFVAAFAASALFVAVMTPLYPANSADMFHYGEQLSPSLDYIKHGKQLFSEIFFLHGAGEDILLQQLSFKLFGTSIGSYILFTYLMRAFCAFLFFMLLALIIRSKGYFLFTVIWFLGSTYSGFDYRKNIAVYIVLGLYWLWLTRALSERARLAILFAIGSLTSFTLINSIDVGVIMTVVCAAVALGLLFTERQKDQTRRLRLPVLKSFSTYKETLALASGGLLVQLLVLIALRSREYGEFLKMTIIDIPKFQGLTWDFPLPAAGEGTFLFWLPIFLAVFALFMLVRIIVSDWQNKRLFTPETLYAGIVMALGLLYLRFGVGRPDQPHVNMSVPVLLVASFFIIQIYVRYMLANRLKKVEVWPVIIFLLLIFWPAMGGWSPMRSLAFGNYRLKDVKHIRDIPKKPDQSWLSEEQKAVTRFIKENSSAQDKIYVFNLEPLYYYLTDRQNPSRFYISWFADPKPYTDELLKELETDPPKYVIYEGPMSTMMSDGVNIKDRIPEINDWVLKNYPQRNTVGQTVILGR